MSATLTLTHDNTSDILKTVDDKELGDFDPNITEPIDPYLIAPKTPVIDSVSAFKYRSTKFVNISFVTFGSRVPVDIVELNWKISGTSNWNTLTDRAENSSIRIESGLPNDGTDIELRVRSRSALSGKWSGWSDVDTFTLNYDNVSNPGKPTSINAYTIKSGIMLEWGVPLNYSNPEYHIKRGDSTDSFEEAISLGKTNNNSFIDDYLSEGDYQYWVYVVDPEQTNIPVSSSVSISGPNRPSVSYQLIDGQLRLDWPSAETDFSIKYYEVWYDAPAFTYDKNYEANDVVEYPEDSGTYYRALVNINSASETPDNSSDWTTPPWTKTDTQFTCNIFFTGDLEFYVKAVDMAGNESSYDITSVHVDSMPRIENITTSSAPYGVVVNLEASIGNPDNIEAIELWGSPGVDDFNDASKVHEWGPMDVFRFNHTGSNSNFDFGDEWFYWATIRDKHGNRGTVDADGNPIDHYPESPTDGVKGKVSDKATDYINLLDSMISDSVISKEFGIDSMEKFFQSEITGRYTLDGLAGENSTDEPEAEGLLNIISRGNAVAEERMAVYDTKDADKYESDKAYSRGAIVKDSDSENPNYYRALRYVPAGEVPSNDSSYWSLMSEGLMSMYSLRIDNGNNVTGFGFSTTSDGNSTFVIHADHFGIYAEDPDTGDTAINDPQSDSNPKPIFAVGNTPQGNNTVGINGDLVINGTLLIGNASDDLTDIHHYGSSAPDSPKAGWFWFDTGTGKLKRYDGSSWTSEGDITDENIAEAVLAASSLPTEPKAGWLVYLTGPSGDFDADTWVRRNDDNTDWVKVGAHNAMKLINGPAESGAEQTTDKSLSILTDRHADNIGESSSRKWASQSGADVTSSNPQAWEWVDDPHNTKPTDNADHTKTAIDGNIITTGYIKDNNTNLLINFGDSRIDVNNDNGLRINSPDGLKIKDGGGLSVEKGGDFTIYNDNSNLNIYSGGNGHVAYIQQTNAAGDIVMGCERLYLHNETLDFQASNNTRFYIDAGGGIGNYLLASTIYNSSGSYRTDFVQDNDHFRFSCPYEYSGSTYNGNNVNYWCTQIYDLADGNAVYLGPDLQYYNGSVELLAHKNGEPSTARMESWYVDKRPGVWEHETHTAGLGDINIKHNDYGHYFQNDSGDSIDVVIRMWYM